MRKGSKMSEESKLKMSESKKGQIPWNKGKIGIYSNEYIQKLKDSHTGYKASDETKRKMSESALKTTNSGRFEKGSFKDLNPSWKGGCDWYLHCQAWDKFGKDNCEHCGLSNEEHILKYGSRLEMHNTIIPKDYRNLTTEAWMTLCKRCHMKLEASIK